MLHAKSPRCRFDVNRIGNVTIRAAKPYICGCFILFSKFEEYRFPGVLLVRQKRQWAEIIPVEPDQDNACAGKVSLLFTFGISSIDFN